MNKYAEETQNYIGKTPKSPLSVQSVQCDLKASKIDTRTPTSMWDLLVWSYRAQMVRYAGGDGFALGGAATSATGRFCADLAAGAVIRGSLAVGGCAAHEDALSVHDYVLRLNPAERDVMMRAAEAGCAPDWNPRLPEVRTVKVTKGDGSVRTLKDKRGRAYASLIAYEGVGEAKRAQLVALARRGYEQWWITLRLLRDALATVDDLSRWRVVSIGAEREPWAAGAVIHRQKGAR